MLHAWFNSSSRAFCIHSWYEAEKGLGLTLYFSRADAKSCANLPVSRVLDRRQMATWSEFVIAAEALNGNTNRPQVSTTVELTASRPLS